MQPLTKRRVHKTILTVIMSCFAIFMILPFIWMISASLKLPGKIFNFPIEWFPKNPQWSNYSEVWSNRYSPFSQYFFNSMYITVLSVLGTLVVSSLAAYAFAKIEFTGKNIIFLCFLATMMVPAQVTLIPRFVVINWLGIFDTHLALILPSVFHIVGIFMMRQFLMKLPNELIESAHIDGAGHLRIYAQIAIPLSIPAMISLTILSFVRVWNDYMNPLVFINTRKLYTVTLAIQSYLNMDGEARYDLAMVAATIAILPVMVLFAFTQKYYIESIQSSGIKG